MVQSLGMNSQESVQTNFIGDHPPVFMDGILSGGSHTSGTVVGIVTATGKKVQLAPAAVDGSEEAAAILYGDLDASSEDEPGIFMEHGVAIGMYVIWPDGITDNEKATAIAQLKVRGVFVK